MLYLFFIFYVSIVSSTIVEINVSSCKDLVILPSIGDTPFFLSINKMYFSNQMFVLLGCEVNVTSKKNLEVCRNLDEKTKDRKSRILECKITVQKHQSLLVKSEGCWHTIIPFSEEEKIIKMNLFSGASFMFKEINHSCCDYKDCVTIQLK